MINYEPIAYIFIVIIVIIIITIIVSVFFVKINSVL